jgi:hypothetical protein
MALQLRDMFTTWYKLLDKVITYVVRVKILKNK